MRSSKRAGDLRSRSSQWGRTGGGPSASAGSAIRRGSSRYTRAVSPTSPAAPWGRMLPFVTASSPGR
eukprot:422715-Pyramimonas_sp.AAC.1